jgi:hypothetical protein
MQCPLDDDNIIQVFEMRSIVGEKPIKDEIKKVISMMPCMCQSCKKICS